MRLINFIRARFRKWLLEERWLEDYLALGMTVGKECSIQPGLVVDVSHCWLIEMGDRVTIAPYVYLLAHDASTKSHTGYARVGRVVIGNDVFIGARTTVMPGVEIGARSIVGAGSVVTKSIPEGVVKGNLHARRISCRPRQTNILFAPVFGGLHPAQRYNPRNEKRDERGPDSRDRLRRIT